MYEVKLWAFGITAISMISCIIKLINPSVSKSSPVITAVNLLIVLSLLYPIANISGYATTFAIDQTISTQTFGTDGYIQNNIEDSIKKLIEDKLQTLGIKAPSILIDITVIEKEVKINKIQVYLSKEDESKIKFCKEQLSKYLELSVEVSLHENE